MALSRLHVWLALWLRRLAWILDSQPLYPTTAQAGQWCVFMPTEHQICGYMSWRVIARRGGWTLGTIEWRNQWATYCFRPIQANETPYNGGTLAEIWTFLRVRQGGVGRVL